MPLNTSLTVINETDVRGRALLELIKSKITFPTALYGFRPEGDSPSGTPYPALYVEPKSQIPAMVTTAKYDLKFVYGIYWYVRGNSQEDVVTQASWIGEALIKLFSNNALNDIGVANPPTNKYKAYSPFWLVSEMLEMRFSVTFLDARTGGDKYERVGRLMFQIEDVILK